MRYVVLALVLAGVGCSSLESPVSPNEPAMNVYKATGRIPEPCSDVWISQLDGPSSAANAVTLIATPPCRGPLAWTAEAPATIQPTGPYTATITGELGEYYTVIAKSGCGCAWIVVEMPLPTFRR